MPKYIMPIQSDREGLVLLGGEKFQVQSELYLVKIIHPFHLSTTPPHTAQFIDVL